MNYEHKLKEQYDLLKNNGQLHEIAMTISTINIEELSKMKWYHSRGSLVSAL